MNGSDIGILLVTGLALLVGAASMVTPQAAPPAVATVAPPPPPAMMAPELTEEERLYQLEETAKRIEERITSIESEAGKP